MPPHVDERGVSDMESRLLNRVPAVGPFYWNNRYVSKLEMKRFRPPRTVTWSS